MSAATIEKKLTSDEFLELPDNGRDRMLIRGKLWDKPFTYHDAFYGAIVAHLGHLLLSWLERMPQLNLKILGGEAGFRLRGEPGSIVGIDVAVAARDQPKYTHKNRVIMEGPPLLAVEILSPSDRQRDIALKVDEYLDVNVPQVWIVDPHFRTVTIHRPGRLPRMVTEQNELSGEEVLPEFVVPVHRIFETM